MPPVRIGFLVKTFPRLSETFILNEILGLEELGWDLRIYSLNPPAEEPVHPAVARVKGPVSYVPALSRNGVLTEPLKTYSAQAQLLLTRPLKYVAAMVRYFRGNETPRRKHFFQAGNLALKLERDGVTHLHAHFANIPAAVAEVVYWLTGIPFSITAHAKDIYTTNEHELARRMRTATGVMTCTEFNARYLRGIAETGVAIDRVYHGIDTERFSSANEARSQRAAGAEPLVLTVGRFSEKKGLEDLLRACALLRDREVKLRCVMVGYGALEERLKELRRELGLETLVEMPGRLAQPQVIEQYRRAAVFALPCVVLENGDRDGIPNVLLESMAAGVPVVTTDVSGIAEVVEDGRTGWLVEPHNPAMLADAIAHALSHDAEAARIAESARERVEAEFSLAASAQRVDAKLRAAVNRGLAKAWEKDGAGALSGEPNA